MSKLDYQASISKAKEEAIFKFLDELRQSGRTNMLGAAPFICEEFDVSTGYSRKLLVKWMENFSVKKPSKVYYCPICYRDFKTLSHFNRRHSRCEPIVKWICVCGKRFKTEGGRDRHYHWEHKRKEELE